MGPSWQEFWGARPFHLKLSLIVSTALCLFHMYTAIFGTLDALAQRGVHLGLGLIIVFLVTARGKNKAGAPAPAWYDWALIALSIAGVGYVLANYAWVTTERFTFITPLYWYEIVFGLCTIVAVLFACTRVISLGMLYCVLGFLAYPLVGPYLPGVFHSIAHGLTDLIDFYYLSLGGIFGIPLSVSATDIALFVIFGAVLMKTGGSTLISNIAMAFAGRMTGGPAKVAIIGSSFFGSITGSTSANVATVGSITIPMMKKAGYKPNFAAAVEAVASCGGQMTPPVMGACAFVMAGFSGIPYVTILKYALFPAILYYFSLFATVHIEAKKLGLRGVDTGVTTKETLRDYGHMFIPVGMLLYLLIAGYSPRFAGGYGILAAIAASQLRRATRLNIIGLLSAFEVGARNILIVLSSTAAAGLIVGAVDVTGFGQRISSGFVGIVGGSLFAGLMLGFLISFLLGLGMPTTPAYIIQAATIIPAMIALGLPNYAAHLFAFYYSCLALITPPDATAAYTAAAIAGADGWKVGWLATRMAAVAFIIPIMFAYNHALLLVGPWYVVLATVVAALAGIWCLAVAGENYFEQQLKPYERLVALVAAILLIWPSWLFVLIGAACFAWLLRVQISARQHAQNRVS
ncbi:MAG TPA: TRAP transporter fused permease subunit [Syntrophorhabdales bacterium]|nr:TRAP transporter fused permease subunit [Syntrophorhabdales bacterium]